MANSKNVNLNVNLENESVKVVDTGHWTYDPSVIIADDMFGFIYLITNNITGKSYIGKKQCTTLRKLKPLKGKTRARRKLTSTDWRTYTGSCNELNADILKHGKENFTFYILEIHSSKWDLKYREAKLQFDNDVLISPKYYNGIINLKLCKKLQKE